MLSMKMFFENMSVLEGLLTNCALKWSRVAVNCVLVCFEMTKLCE